MQITMNITNEIRNTLSSIDIKVIVNDIKVY